MKTLITLIGASVFWAVSVTQAAYAGANSWQMTNLFEPSMAQIEREQKGRVTIYHGMKDIDVNRVMNEQFERIESMMFIGTVVTDGAGQPLRDPATGAVVVEDDGCE